MGQSVRDDQPSSMADKIAAINVAKALFGPVAARKMWAEFGLPDVGTADRAITDMERLRGRIVKLSSNDGGMTLGVLVNRCRTFGRDEVERAVKDLISEGLLRSESAKGGNGKTFERLITN